MYTLHVYVHACDMHVYGHVHMCIACNPENRLQSPPTCVCLASYACLLVGIARLLSISLLSSTSQGSLPSWPASDRSSMPWNKWLPAPCACVVGSRGVSGVRHYLSSARGCPLHLHPLSPPLHVLYTYALYIRHHDHAVKCPGHAP